MRNLLKGLLLASAACGRPAPSEQRPSADVLTSATCIGTRLADGSMRIPADAAEPSAWIAPEDARITSAVLLPPNNRGERHVHVSGWIRAPAPDARGVLQFGMSDTQGVTHGAEAVRAADDNCIVWRGREHRIEWTLTSNRAFQPYMTANPPLKYYTIKTANKLGPANAPDIARRYFQYSITITDSMTAR